MQGNRPNEELTNIWYDFDATEVHLDHYFPGTRERKVFHLQPPSYGNVVASETFTVGTTAETLQ
jgi:hypothetical protein